MKNYFTLLIFIIATCLTQSCKKDSDNIYGLEPNYEQDLVNHALRLKGKLIEGNIPAPTGTNAPIIVGYPSAVQVSAGVVLFIPYQISNPQQACKLYLQVEGSKSYWDAQIVTDSFTNGTYLEILIPNFVQNGNFNLRYAVADCSGNVSTYVSTNTIVTPPLGCGDVAEGSVGITVLHFTLGNKSGAVRVNYDMYTIPDRLDVRYNNVWIGSTGTMLNNAAQGPQCGLDGFVSSNNNFTFNYNPSNGKDLSVYVSGCNSGTAWTVSVDCP